MTSPLPHVTFQRLLERQNRQVDLTGLSSTYMVILNHIWNARNYAACEAVSVALANDPETEHAPKLYRAWIEALANIGDNDSLAALGTHLLHLGRDESTYGLECRFDFMGLRGIIHAELDQAPAMRLLSRAMQGRGSSIYVLEFEQMCARRGIVDADYPIAHATVNVDDYFVWNALLQEFSVGGHRDLLNDGLRHVDKVFPGSPLLHQFEFHLAVEHNDWQAGINHAAKLRTQFNSHPDYNFFEAYATFKSHDLDGALRVIESITPEKRAGDVDLLNLYGECLAVRAQRDDSDQDAHASIATLNSAARHMQRFGLAVDRTFSLIRKMEDRVGGHSVPTFAANQFRQPRSWLVVLSPSRADEMVNAHDSQVEELYRPMGSEAEPGDVVLFVSRSAHTSKKPATNRHEWRLLSMYRVTSRPYWHPVFRWHSTLELIDRPEHPVPIDAQEIKSDVDIRGKKSLLPRGHHARYNVFSLDDSAMDIMIAAVKRRSGGVDHKTDRRSATLINQKPG